MNIILSTTNPSKAEQIKAMFNNPNITVQTLHDAGISGEAVEDGSTLEENAYKKACYARQQTFGRVWTMADDTGLFITGLDGEPGIKAARWAGETATTEETMWHALNMMKDLTDRTAIFRTVVVLLGPGGITKSFIGEISGVMATEAKAKPQAKMPYSPLFIPDGTGKSWAEMTIEEENAISHRGKAFRQVVEYLESLPQ